MIMTKQYLLCKKTSIRLKYMFFCLFGFSSVVLSLGLLIPLTMLTVVVVFTLPRVLGFGLRLAYNGESLTLQLTDLVFLELSGLFG
jgi:hypothetical protein